MQDSVPSPQAPLTRSVASRLKKSLASPQGADRSGNGSSGGPERYADSELGEAGEAALPRVALSPVDQQIVRVIGQYLKNLGMNGTVSALVAEGSCELELPAAARFRLHVVGAEWDMVMSDLRALEPHLKEPGSLVEIKFRVLEQKYLELLQRGLVVDALRVLRQELGPLGYRRQRVHELAALLMLNNTPDLQRAAGWAGSSPEARHKLVESLGGFLPASVMLPPRRLEGLLSQALQWQYSHCRLHNRLHLPEPSLNPAALLLDHSCSPLGFPWLTRSVGTEHCDEVWCCAFSNSGRFMASGAKDANVIIWELIAETTELRAVRRLPGHGHGVSFLAWSPDDRFLAVMGLEDSPDMWIWNVEKGEQRVHMNHQAEDCLSAVSWAPDAKSLVVAGMKGNFYHCDLDGNVLDTLEGVRIRSLWAKKDNKTVLGADTHNRIRSYSFDDMSETDLIRETDPLIYFCLDNSERYALVTTKGQGMHLWDLESRQLVRRYRGSTHGEYVTVSCFGGLNQDFIATGSEDGGVYIWHREREEPVKVLRGHSGVVNAVSWSPTDPSLLVSCSDDGTIRLWGPPLTGACGDEEERGMDVAEPLNLSSTAC